MNWVGTAERIFTAPDAGVEMTERGEVEAIAGAGLRGDRYFREIETGTFVKWKADEERPDGYDLTLIEREAIHAIEREAEIKLDSGEHRRNIVTQNAALNHLVVRRPDYSFSNTSAVSSVSSLASIWMDIYEVVHGSAYRSTRSV
ncbi:hypothetical protein [Natronococcus wangiae]|uniref:hypothetical protein n=1 Tax=Natronococcus wangiae TaxID=3068275 RepID=UPI00274011FF|nr:hypothetical protein [Natronococcus sp. AD5]